MTAQTNAGWYVISLRPEGEHAALRRAARRAGARVVAASPWRIETRDDDATRRVLAEALAADAVVFTSPAAVRSAAMLGRMHARDGQSWIAVGSGTARALGMQGIANVIHPARMDSEGLLDLPILRSLEGRSVGLVTAPEGRGVIASTLIERGARLITAEVYDRRDIPLSPRAIEGITHASPACVFISSGGALDRVLAGLPANARACFVSAVAIVASARLGEQAMAAGFQRVVQAEGPRHAQMLRAAVNALDQVNPLA